MEKNCLIIDNEDQKDEIEGIERNAKNKGVNLTCYQFNVGSTFREDLLNESKAIDIEKVVIKFKEEFSGIAFDLIAFDWDLSDETINGVELIRQFQARDVRRSTPKILYSGILKDQIASMLQEFKTDKREEKQLVLWLNSLIRTPIVEFIDRPEYASTIVSILEKSHVPLEFHIESELRKLKDYEFKSAFPDFAGKKYGEIADIIDTNSELGNRFKKELINQLISYLTAINLD